MYLLLRIIIIFSKLEGKNYVYLEILGNTHLLAEDSMETNGQGFPGTVRVVQVRRHPDVAILHCLELSTSLPLWSVNLLAHVIP